MQRGAVLGAACATMERGAARATVDAVGVQQGMSTNFQGTLNILVFTLGF